MSISSERISSSKYPFFTIFSLILSMLVPAFWSAPLHAEELSIDSAINKAGRQRMLTQRMLKSYMLIGQKVAEEEALEMLDASVATFEQQLEELEDFAPNDQIARSLDAVREEWRSFRRQIIGKPNKNRAAQLIEEGENLLALCERSVQLLDSYANNAKGQLINKSGRQRMLSQRIGMLYAAHSWGVGNKVLKEKFDIALKEYDDALNFLTASSLNSKKISSALGKVQSRWEFSRSGFELMGSERYVPYIIQVTTESMLKRMNKITGMYERVENAAKSVAMN